VLDRCTGNKREASRVLGISYHTLNSYLRYPVGAMNGAEEEADPVGSEDEPVDHTVTAGA